MDARFLVIKWGPRPIAQSQAAFLRDRVDKLRPFLWNLLQRLEGLGYSRTPLMADAKKAYDGIDSLYMRCRNMAYNDWCGEHWRANSAKAERARPLRGPFGLGGRKSRG